MFGSGLSFWQVMRINVIEQFWPLAESALLTSEMDFALELLMWFESLIMLRFDSVHYYFISIITNSDHSVGSCISRLIYKPPRNAFDKTQLEEIFQSAELIRQLSK